MTFYQFLVLVHVFSAIVGMGPGFVLTLVFKRAENMTELRHAYKLRTRLHIYVMIGGTLLLVTGLAMGYMNPALFKSLWYVVSLSLFLVALSFGPFVLKPITTPIKKLLREYDKGEEIPEEYYQMEKKLFFWEHIENIIFLIIIAFMILKPYNFNMLLKLLFLN